MASSSSALFVNPISGNVGIGTTTPLYQLDMIGYCRNTTCAFRVYRLATAASIVGGAGVYITNQFDTKQFDLGNNYNLTTGRFTAPINGVYFFNSALRFYGSGTQLGYRYRIFDASGIVTSLVGAACETNNVTEGHYSTSGYAYLVAGGYVMIECYYNARVDTNGYSHFGGHLIMPA